MQSLDECWEKKKKTKENFASRYHSSRDMVIAWQTLEFILHEWVLNLLFFSLRCLVMLRLSRTLSAFVYHRWAAVGADQLIVSSLYINISLKEKSCFCSRVVVVVVVFLTCEKPRNMQKQACKTSKTQREKVALLNLHFQAKLIVRGNPKAIPSSQNSDNSGRVFLWVVNKYACKG